VIALLDVNILVALFDDAHVHHQIAHDWFADNCESGWASCPLTENGMLRFFSSPARADLRVPVPELVELLNQFRASSDHQFWPDVISFSDAQVFNVRSVRGHKQLTDVYLLGLAVKHGGRFVTFDGGVPLASVKGARKEHLEVIAPLE
jgi:toxin-antitoxin system PIN domain toxin